MTGVVQLVMQSKCVSDVDMVCLGSAWFCWGPPLGVIAWPRLGEIAGCIRSLGQASFMWDIGRSVDIITDVESNDADVRL